MNDKIVDRGYSRCNIPACNCKSWHGGHALQRLHEIYEALGSCKGTTVLKEVERIMQAERALAESASHQAAAPHEGCACYVCRCIVAEGRIMAAMEIPACVSQSSIDATDNWNDCRDKFRAILAPAQEGDSNG